MFKDILLGNIRLYFGEGDTSFLAELLGIVGILLIFFTIMIYVNGMLRRFRNISATEAIRFGMSQDKTKVHQRLTLHRNRFLNTHVFLGIKDVLARKKLYATMLIVLVIAVFIIQVPQNLYSTISSSSFIQYMGIGDYDIRVQQTSHQADQVVDMIQELENDEDVSKFAVLTTKTFKVLTNDGSEENMKIELGDHSIFPIAYTEGKAPDKEDEIALSIIIAEEMDKAVGDRITLVINEQTMDLTVSGLYSDITNGGKTAKAVFMDDSPDIIWSIGYVKLADTSLVEQKMVAYEKSFEFARVADVDEYVKQTFGSIVDSVRAAANVATFIALGITMLVTVMFMQLLIAKDKYTIAVFKAFGFTQWDMRQQYLSRSIFVLALGMVIGMILVNTVGESLAGIVISMLGASTFQFEIQWLTAYILNPLMMIGAVLIATWIGISGLRQIKISENIKE